jgi:hypothetical protein
MTRSFISYTLQQVEFNDVVKKDEIEGACRTQGIEEECV